MAAISWDKNLDANARESLYQLYSVLFRAKGLSARNKQRSFEAAADGTHSWPIVGITGKALRHLCEEGTCDGLRRAHLTKRADRATGMFVRDQPFTEEQLFTHFFEMDKVVIATRPENGTQKALEGVAIHAIPVELFTKNGMKAVASPADLAWAISFAKEQGLDFTAKYEPKRPRGKRKTGAVHV
jgi:hypothetical protein